MGFVEKKVDQATNVLEKVAGRTLDTIGDVIQKVGDTIENIVKDPKKLAMVGLAVAFPGAAATIGSSLGLTGTAASVVGQTLINTAINGGDIEQAVKGAAISYVGIEAAGEIGRIAKDSGASDAIAKTVGQAGGQAITAAAMGQDPVLALVAGGANVASNLITEQIPGFADLPGAAQGAVKAAVAAELQDKDASGAAVSSLVSSATNYAKTYAKVQTDLLGKGLSPLDQNSLAAIKDADATDISNVVKAAETAKSYGSSLDAEDIAGITSADNQGEFDAFVTDNIINPAKAEQAGFGEDVNAWEEAQSVGISDPKTWQQYSSTADMYQDVFGKYGDPEDIKAYMPHKPQMSDSLDAMKVYLGKKEATPEELERLDFDGSGKVDLNDVTNLTKYYLGKTTSVPPSDYWTENSTPEEMVANMKADYPKVAAEDAGFGEDIDSWRQATDLGLGKKQWDQYQSISEMYEDVYGEKASYDELKQYMPRQATSADVTGAMKVYLGKTEATPELLERYDFDGNGKVDLSDVTNLNKYQLGKQTNVAPSDYWSEMGTLDQSKASIQAAYDRQQEAAKEDIPAPVAAPTPAPGPEVSQTPAPAAVAAPEATPAAQATDDLIKAIEGTSAAEQTPQAVETTPAATAEAPTTVPAEEVAAAEMPIDQVLEEQLQTVPEEEQVAKIIEDQLQAPADQVAEVETEAPAVEDLATQIAPEESTLQPVATEEAVNLPTIDTGDQVAELPTETETETAAQGEPQVITADDGSTLTINPDGTVESTEAPAEEEDFYKLIGIDESSLTDEAPLSQEEIDKIISGELFGTDKTGGTKVSTGTTRPVTVPSTVPSTGATSTTEQVAPVEPMPEDTSSQLSASDMSELYRMLYPEQAQQVVQAEEQSPYAQIPQEGEIDPEMAAFLESLGIDPEEVSNILAAPGAKGSGAVAPGMGVPEGTFKPSGKQTYDVYKALQKDPSMAAKMVGLPLAGFNDDYINKFIASAEKGMNPAWATYRPGVEIARSFNPPASQGEDRAAAYVPKFGVSSYTGFRPEASGLDVASTPEFVGLVTSNPTYANDPTAAANLLSHELTHIKQVDPNTLLTQAGATPGKGEEFSKDLAAAIPYLQQKYGYTGGYDTRGKAPLSERFADLMGWQFQNNIDFSNDPEFQKMVLKTPERVAAWNASTIPRTTRLDPRDLPPGKIVESDFGLPGAAPLSWQLQEKLRKLFPK